MGRDDYRIQEPRAGDTGYSTAKGSRQMGKAQGIAWESGKVYHTAPGLLGYGYIPKGQGDYRSR